RLRRNRMNSWRDLAIDPRGTDEARYREAFLDKIHAAHHDQIQYEVEVRRHGEGLEYLEAELLHGARCTHQLEQADSEGYRRILDQVQQLGCQWWKNDPE